MKLNTNSTQNNFYKEFSEKIKKLGKVYKHFNKYIFDKYIEGKDITDYRLLLRAFIYENENYSRLKNINISLDNDNIDKEATEILILIRDLVNSKKIDRTKIYIGALMNITGASSWSGLNNYFSHFRGYINSLDFVAFKDSPNEIIEQFAKDHKLDEAKKVSFIKYLLLRVVMEVSQKRESPPVIERYIQEGMFKNDIEIVSKSTFNRNYKSIDDSNRVLKMLTDMLEKYKDNLIDLFNLVDTYHINNYASKLIYEFGESDNLAIKIPKYKSIDYTAIKLKAEKILSSKNSNKSTNSISLEKVVLFLFLVRMFNVDDKDDDDRIFISNNKLSKYLGDPKVVSSIRDAYFEEGVFNNMENALIETWSTSYDLSLSTSIENYIVLNDPYLIKKLNDDLSVIQGYFVGDRLFLLDQIIDIIEINRNKDSERINLTNIFMKTGSTSPIRQLLKIVVTLKSRVSGYLVKNIDKDLEQAFKSIDYALATKLFLCSRNKMMWFLKKPDNTLYFNFYVPTLIIATEEEAKKDLYKKYNEEYIKNNPDEFEKSIKEQKVKMMESKNENFIKKLKEYCNINDDKVEVPIGNKVEDAVEDDNLPGI